MTETTKHTIELSICRDTGALELSIIAPGTNCTITLSPQAAKDFGIALIEYTGYERLKKLNHSTS